MNKIHINSQYCKGCLICVEVCPKKAIKASEHINRKGFLLPVEDDKKNCNGCRLCETVCPDFAIAIESEK
jgi:2-oxoglutarate ferredoxin oxidoreductase subunit delta